MRLFGGTNPNGKRRCSVSPFGPPRAVLGAAQCLLGGLNTWCAGIGSAEREAACPSEQNHQGSGARRLNLEATGRCLTPRSSGPPTAWRLGRVAVWFIIVHAAKAPHRWRPLNSNVRQHTGVPLRPQQEVRLSA